MPRAINWPKEYLEEIAQEDCDVARIALRLGSIYFDNNYYRKGDIVDIRVNHSVVRQAEIVDVMKLTKIKYLEASFLGKYKTNLYNTNNVIDFLGKTYNQKVDENTCVTVIIYKNRLMPEEEKTDDPHM